MIQRANTALSLRRLPKLPDGATNVRCWTGGTFAKYLNVKFTASPDQALDYLRRADATHYLEFQIEGKDYRILATHSLTGAPADTDKPELWCLTNRTGILSQAWFKSVYDIRHGWYCRYGRGAPARCTLYYDVGAQQFYVYWTYS